MNLGAFSSTKKEQTTHYVLLGLYGPEYHRVDLSGDVTDVEQPNEQTREDRALSQWNVGRLGEQFFEMNVKKCVQIEQNMCKPVGKCSI